MRAQIKELREMLQALEVHINQNTCNSSKSPSTTFSKKNNPKSLHKWKGCKEYENILENMILKLIRPLKKRLAF
ncbi:DUF6444 domain-containing protein [Methanosarcina sp. 1.H.T.1A.1]|uniref:DUF6444 domain-containing protein n=1 Tax=Methanosarcina sp. 1.H.T.1A.1 TaxID=1483602 RepID=UPI00373AEF6E